MTPTQVLSCEFCKVSKNTYFEKHLLFTLNRFYNLSYCFIVDFEQVSGDWEANGVKTKQVRSIKNYFDIFIETMFAFLFHFITENYKPQSYCFERNNKIWCLNGYNFKLYQTMFHKKTVLFMVYKLLLKVH